MRRRLGPAYVLVASGLLICMACAQAADADGPSVDTGAVSLGVEVDGRTQTLDRSALVALAGEQQALDVIEPHEQVSRTYVGVSANRLLQALFGDRWRQASQVRFTCADGYRALIDPQRFVDHPAVLAWARGDGAPFDLINRLQGDEQVPLGPFYLVWDNRGNDALLALGASDWPYQVVAIDLVDLQSDLPLVVPPADAGASAHRGFVAFRQHCLICHSINGQGGAKAPELNIPISVTEYFADGWLQRWMLDPASMRRGTTMPPLAAGLPDRERMADDIVDYLRVMAANKRGSESE